MLNRVFFLVKLSTLSHELDIVAQIFSKDLHTIILSGKRKGQDSLTAIFCIRLFDCEPSKISFLAVTHFFIWFLEPLTQRIIFSSKSFFGLSVKTIDISKVFGYTILNESGGEQHDYPTTIFKHAENLP